MKNLTSRWNTEPRRVFDVEERDGCLILTKRPTTILKRTLPICGFALFSMVWGWRIYEESPVFDINWFGVATPVVVGLTMLLLPIWEIWRTYRGDVWVFDRQKQQINHSGLLIMSLKSLEKVEVERVEDSENPDYFRFFVMGKKALFELVDQNGSEREYLEIGQRIADFAQVPLVRSRQES